MGEEPGGLGIPGRWEEISPAWMTAALAGSCPGVEVSRVEVLLRDDGTNRRARLGVSYRTGTGPTTVFVKAADPAHTKLNARTGGVSNEPRLFLSDVPLPLDHPEVHLALIDEPNLDFLLVMEDITQRGGEPRDATRPLTVAQAADGVRGLARLHGHYWGERLDRHPTLAWVAPFAAWRGMAIGIGIGIGIGIWRAADTIPPEVARLGGEEIEGHHWARYLETVSQGPATLLHGDPHIGNTYVLPGDRVGFLGDLARHRRVRHPATPGGLPQARPAVRRRVGRPRLRRRDRRPRASVGSGPGVRSTPDPLHKPAFHESPVPKRPRSERRAAASSAAGGGVRD